MNSRPLIEFLDKLLIGDDFKPNSRKERHYVEERQSQVGCGTSRRHSDRVAWSLKKRTLVP